MDEKNIIKILNICLPSPENDISAYFDHRYKVSIKRDDLIHPEISGNKWRKLKYHIHRINFQSTNHILTVGGAYSNHILAVAALAKALGIKSTAIVRGEEANLSNSTLKQAIDMGMECVPISREAYKDRNNHDFKNYWLQQYPGSYWIAEGGQGYLGVQGCMEIMKEISDDTEIVVVSAGTGTTASGILLSLKEHQQLWVIPALKGDFMKTNIEELVSQTLGDKDVAEEYLKKLKVWSGHAGRGFGKINEELKDYVQNFFERTGIQLDYVYTGKVMMALEEILKLEQIDAQTKITFIHTGGVQGNKGFRD